MLLGSDPSFETRFLTGVLKRSQSVNPFMLLGTSPRFETVPQVQTGHIQDRLLGF